VLNELAGNYRPGSAMRIGWLDEGGAAAQNCEPEFSFSDLIAFSGGPLDSANTANDPAYIMFTSGSTGSPKGVVITHSNVIHFIEWAVPYFGLNQSDRLSCHSPLHFDLSVFDIFGAFAAGAELHLVAPDLNVLPNKLADFIRDSSLTQWFSVPSVLNYMAKFDVVKANDFPALKRLLWCGEVLPAPALTYFMSDCLTLPSPIFMVPLKRRLPAAITPCPIAPWTGEHPFLSAGRAMAKNCSCWTRTYSRLGRARRDTCTFKG
jgi:acyl-coenzyme A synthetase/AMP-(fatty) acid ligase